MQASTTSFDGVPGIECRPLGEPRGGVVVLHEAFGLTPYLERVVATLADAGFHAAAPDLFHRYDGDRVAGYDEYDKVQPMLAAQDDATLLADVDATISHLGAAPSRVGVLGFCMGGRGAFLVGASMELGAAVTFYGAGIVGDRGPFRSLLHLLPTMTTPWLGLFGDQDEAIPAADITLLADRVNEPHRVERFPNAGHGFHCDDRGSYQPEAAARAWSLAMDWLGTHLA